MDVYPGCTFSSLPSPEIYPGCTPLFSPREAPRWVFNTVLNQRGTTVGIFLLLQPGRHHGGYILPFLTQGGTTVGISPFYTQGGTTVGINFSFLHPRGGTPVGINLYSHPSGRHHGGYKPPVSPLGGTPVGINLPVSHPERYPGGV